MAAVDIVGTSTEILSLMDGRFQDDRQIIVYPSLDDFRRIYSKYTKKHLERENDIVVLLPYYETVDNVIAVLQKNGVDVAAFGRQGFLIIRDAYKTYSGFGEDRELLFKRILLHAAATGRTGVSIILDMGAFSLITEVQSMAMSYQGILPRHGPLKVRGFLSYHKDDYARLSQEQKTIRFAGNYKILLVTE